MAERKGLVTFKGNPLTLLGQEVKVGDPAPDFEVLDNALNPFRFSLRRNQACIIASVPSLDTPVCDFETHRFNEEASKLGPKVAILTISMDLPFAQKRWCGAAGVANLQTLSDHRHASFWPGLWSLDQRTAVARSGGLRHRCRGHDSISPVGEGTDPGAGL